MSSTTTPVSETEPGRRLVRLSKAAEYTDETVKTIRRRISDGTLTGFRFGPRHILVDLNEIDAALRPIPAIVRAVS